MKIKSKFLRISLSILTIAMVLVAIAFIFRVQIVTHFIPTVEQTGEIQIKIINDTAFISS